tara:strand:- start:438 stop:614 length:177 start_codon:yes stop_codon:yes gene_type:complete
MNRWTGVIVALGSNWLSARVIATLRPIKGNLYELGEGYLASFLDAPSDFRFCTHKTQA